MFSAAKAIVAVAILIAIDESRLSLDDPITKFFKDSLPENYSERFDRMTVYDLLTMHTGHANGPFAMMIKAGGDRARSFVNNGTAEDREININIIDKINSFGGEKQVSPTPSERRFEF